jgi:hypothetical protein
MPRESEPREAALPALLDRAVRAYEEVLAGGRSDGLGVVARGVAIRFMVRLVALAFTDRQAGERAPVGGGPTLEALLEDLEATHTREPGSLETDFSRSIALAERGRRAHAAGLGALFDPDDGGFVVSDACLLRTLRCLSTGDGARHALSGFEVEHIGSVYEHLMGCEDGTPLAARARRRTGSHYTPRALTGPIVQRTLAPLLARSGRLRPEDVLDLRVVDPAMGSGAFLLEVCRQLGAALVAAWHAHGGPPAHAVDVDPQRAAMRLVARRCLFGVDSNPDAVTLARLSLRCLTDDLESPAAVFDEALRHGDALLGLSARQIEAFDPTVADEPAAPTPPPVLRTPADARRRGDLCVSAFFAGRTKPDRLRTRREALALWSRAEADGSVIDDALASLRGEPRTLCPFHWHLEFPEVFARSAPGFDAVVGNPPFLGGRNLSAAHGDDYNAWLRAVFPGSSGSADLVAFFFRRAFDLLRPGGTLGLIATNTISQGDTRRTGLAWICTHGGTIYAARRRVRWPGDAAVMVSVVWLARGPAPVPCRLDEREVPSISAYLFHAGGHGDPARQPENVGGCLQGSIVLGVGFTFDDARADATPLAEMHRLVAKDPRNAERILPFLGGDEVTTSPTHAHRRYVIDFGERTEAEARAWPDLMALVEAKVRPERVTKDARKYPRMVHEWWKYWNARPELRRRLADLDEVLVTSLVSTHCVFARVSARCVHSHKLGVFPVAAPALPALLAILQSRVHELWARFQSSTLGDALNYSPTDCFETFPMPEGWETNAALASAGRAYETFRAALMVRNGQGLTATYNRFHDPSETAPDLVELRRRHGDLDRAVLEAFGFTDVPADCVFGPVHAEGPETTVSGALRRGSFRYRWPAEVHDEVLARLMVLNAERARRG